MNGSHPTTSIPTPRGWVQPWGRWRRSERRERPRDGVVIRVSLNPDQTDTAENKSFNLQCGDYAETLDTTADVDW